LQWERGRSAGIWKSAQAARFLTTAVSDAVCERTHVRRLDARVTQSTSQERCSVCVCVCVVTCAPRNVDGKECELGGECGHDPSARAPPSAQKRGGWVERANVICSHVFSGVQHPDARAWIVDQCRGVHGDATDGQMRANTWSCPKCCRRVSGDVWGERHCVLLMRCSE
jgi:hypothetical protein